MNHRSAKKKIPRLAWMLLGLFITGAGIRIAAVLLFSDRYNIIYEYMEIGRNLADGLGYSYDQWNTSVLQPTSSYVPLYIYWCWLFIKISPFNFLAMYIIQGLIGASGVFPAYLAGRKLFSKRAGLVIATIYTFYPECAFLPAKPVPEFAVVVMTLWIIYLYTVIAGKSLMDRNYGLYTFSTGIAIGLTTLIKASSIVLIAAIMTALFLKKRREIGSYFKRGLIPLILGFTLTMSFWVIRNYNVQGEFILLRTGGGYAFWVGNNPFATGTSLGTNGKALYLSMTDEYLNFVHNEEMPLDEQGQDRRFNHLAKQYIKEHPGRFIELCFKRLIYFFWKDPYYGTTNNILYISNHFLLLIFSSIGIILSVKNKQPVWILGLIIAGLAAMYMPTLVLPRYRIVSNLMLMLFAGYALEAILSRWRFFRRSISFPDES